MNISLTPQNTDKEEKTVLEPVEAYVDWMRNELNSGRWIADPTQPCLLYKVYTSVKRIPLDTNIPLRFGIRYKDILHLSSLPSLQAKPEQLLSCLLYYTHGLTRYLRPEAGVSSLHWTKTKEHPESLPEPKHLSGPVAHSSPFLARPVPSGGSLHPTELYLALGTGWQIPAGMYHYDSAHHALDQLRLGDFTPAIAKCFPGQCWPTQGSLALFPAISIQKNHQKYTNLSYWLQTLDAGILIEQLHLVARCLQFSATAHLRFPDAPLHHLLGLDTYEENIYAVLTLNTALLPRDLREENTSGIETQALSKLSSLTATHIQPFTPHAQSSLLKALYVASLSEEHADPPNTPTTVHLQSSVKEEHALVLPTTMPDVSQDITQTLLRRRTEINSLESSPLQITDIAALFASLQNAESPLLTACHYQLYCVAARVEMVPVGVYRYQDHTLVPVHQAHILEILSRISTGVNIAPHLAPVNLFLCADYRQALKHYGTRGFRMLGLEIGRTLQRISLAAAASNLATHIHQSYHIEGTRKALLQISSPDCLPLASMMVGHPRSSQGGLFEPVWY